MSVNFATKNIILIKYPFGAGGKFISYCLSIHDKILPINYKHAENKIKGQNTFLNHLKILNANAKSDYHLEEGEDDQCYHTKKFSSFFVKISNQKFFYLPKTSHLRNFDYKFPYMNYVGLYNVNKLNRTNNTYELNKWEHWITKQNLPNLVKFNILSCFDEKEFQKEIIKILKFLKISTDMDYKMLERYRLLFVKSRTFITKKIIRPK